MSGAILPLQTPADGAALDHLFQQLVVNLTAIDGKFVRPRWQPQPPAQPPAGTDWAAIGIMRRNTLDYPDIVAQTDTTAIMRRQSIIDVLVSFYGPNAYINACNFRDGCYVPTQLDALRDAGLGFMEAGDVLNVPEQDGPQWILREDMTMRFRRSEDRLYPLPAIAEAPFDIIFTP